MVGGPIPPAPAASPARRARGPARGWCELVLRFGALFDAWHAVQTHVRRRVMRWGSRLSVHGISLFAPQRGHVSVC